MATPPQLAEALAAATSSSENKKSEESQAKKEQEESQAKKEQDGPLRVGFVGVSGAGKTTIVNALLGAGRGFLPIGSMRAGSRVPCEVRFIGQENKARLIVTFYTKCVRELAPRLLTLRREEWGAARAAQAALPTRHNRVRDDVCMDYGDEAMLREVYGDEVVDDPAQLAHLRDPAWEAPEVEEQLKVGRIVEEYNLWSEAAAEKLSKSLRGWLQGNEAMCDAASRLVKGVELEIGLHGTDLCDIGMRPSGVALIQNDNALEWLKRCDRIFWVAEMCRFTSSSESHDTARLLIEQCPNLFKNMRLVLAKLDRYDGTEEELDHICEKIRLSLEGFWKSYHKPRTVGIIASPVMRTKLERGRGQISGVSAIAGVVADWLHALTTAECKYCEKEFYPPEGMVVVVNPDKTCQVVSRDCLEGYSVVPDDCFPIGIFRVGEPLPPKEWPTRPPPAPAPAPRKRIEGSEPAPKRIKKS